MMHKIIRLFLCYIGGIIFALTIGEGVWHLCFLSEYLFDISFFYVPTVLHIMLLIAWPIGLSLGMYSVGKLLLRTAIIDVWAIPAGFFAGLFSILLFGYILPLFGLNILDWAPIILGRNIDVYMFLMVAAFFSLIGYNSLSFFKKPHSKASKTRNQALNGNITTNVDVASETGELPKLKRNTISSSKLPLIILSVSILLILLLIAFRPTPWKAEQKARGFLEKVLVSVNDSTDFYKKHSTENVMRNIEEQKTKISKDYIIEVFNNEGPYEYFVTFDKKYTFKADINYSGGLILYKFYFIPNMVGYRLDLSD